jgi:DNA adenine methylase
MGIKYLSPLRYPGAKRQMAPEIGKLLKESNYQDCVFVEPCCGGASVSLYLLKNELVSSVILADKDPWVASFWKVLFTRTEELLHDIKMVDVNAEKWRYLKERKPVSDREKAFYCFFFNRTCYSGILDGGMIGGHNQESEYKMDCRFNKPDLMERIRWIADRFASKVQVREASVFDILDEAKTSDHQDQVYYIDPPYIDIELYPHDFKKEEHKKLKTCLESFNRPWILSYQEHPEILEMYGENTSLEHKSIDVFWVANGAKAGKELLISNLPSLRKRIPTLLTASVDRASANEEIMAEI